MKVDMTTEEAMLYLNNLPLPELFDNSEKACMERNKYIIAIHMGIKALQLLETKFETKIDTILD